MGFITGVVSIVLTAYSLREWWRHKANKALFKNMGKTSPVTIKGLTAQEAYNYAKKNIVDLEAERLLEEAEENGWVMRAEAIRKQIESDNINRKFLYGNITGLPTKKDKED